MPSAADEKLRLRQQLRRLRRGIPPAEARRAARAVARYFGRQRVLRRARHVALYLAAGSELSTAPLIAALLARGVAVYAPRIARGQALRFLRIEGDRHRRRHAHGMAQPVGRAMRPLRRMDLLLMPLLAFDAQGHRLGQGGGYYDRALARLGLHRPLRIGLAYALQEQPALPAEPWDQRLHAVVTERGLRWLARSR